MGVISCRRVINRQHSNRLALRQSMLFFAQLSGFTKHRRKGDLDGLDRQTRIRDRLLSNP
jgi:hypothetical protein